MTRFAAYLIPLLLAASTAVPRSFAEIRTESEWKKLEEEAREDLYGLSKRKRFEIIAKLGDANYLKAVQLLVMFIEKNNPRLAPLEQKEREILKDIQQLNKIAASLGNKMTLDDMQRMKNLQAELKEIHDAILRESDLKDSAVEAIARTRDPAILGWLKASWRKSKSQAVQIAVIRAFGLIGSQALTAEIFEAAMDRDPQVRTAAIESLAGRPEEAPCDLLPAAFWNEARLPFRTPVRALRLAEIYGAILKALGDEFWQVRCTAVRILGDFGDLAAVEPLIAALEKEPGRIRGDIDEALQKLTGKSLDGDYLMWKAWWASHGSDVKAGKAAGAGGPAAESHDKTVSFYGIKTRSKNILFIIDVSGSMEWKSKSGKKDGGGQKPAPAPPAGGGGFGGSPAAPGPADDRKISVAKWELKQAIANLEEDALFNLIYYGTEVKMFQPKMVPASKGMKLQAIKLIDEIKAGGGTNIYDSLVKAFTLGGGDNEKKNFENSVDTIFFLSDGVPTAGKITDTDLILKDIRHRNKVRKIIINAVGITTESDKPEEQSRLEEFVRKLAEQNGGKYVQK